MMHDDSKKERSAHRLKRLSSCYKRAQIVKKNDPRTVEQILMEMEKPEFSGLLIIEDAHGSNLDFTIAERIFSGKKNELMIIHNGVLIPSDIKINAISVEYIVKRSLINLHGHEINEEDLDEFMRKCLSAMEDAETNKECFDIIDLQVIEYEKVNNLIRKQPVTA